MASSFIKKLQLGKKPIGTFVTLGAPEVAELLSTCGYDWLLIDMEHSVLDVEDVQRIVQATHSPCSTIVRIPENSPGWIKKVLDTGCDGLMVPHVNGPEEAAAAVAAAKYPPLGGRSVGVSRAQGYGASFTEYLEHANESVALIVQIEHQTAVNNVERIIDIPGVDAVLIGPYDLSGSMDLLGQLTHSDVRAAIAKVKSSCQSKKMPVGIFVMRPEDAKRELDSGCTFVAFGIDTSTLLSAARAQLETARGE